MLKIFEFIYFFYKKATNRPSRYIRQFFYFFSPNIINIIRHRIIYNKSPRVSQFMICEGNGIVEIGNNCSFGIKMGGFHRGGSIELQARNVNAIIKIGNNIATNNNIVLCAENYIEIGDNTLIGQNVTIMDHEAHDINPEKRRQIGEIGKVIIGKNTWLGNNVIILKNSEIGDNSIVASGAIVTRKFPANVIIGGVPAKIIKTI
jgi:acetyltransferase-like isoleucine patch superfamily enzyme